MELRQLEYFIAVAEEASFSRAAARLHVSQPTISEQVKALEQELGARLLERSSRAVSLSPAGTDILPLARELLADAQRLREHAQLSARRVAGRLRIGFLADEYATPEGDRLIASMRRDHPRVTIEFHQVDFAEHHDALQRGLVDVAFVMGPVSPTLEAVPITTAPRLLAVSRAALEDGGNEPASSIAEGQAVVLPTRFASHEWRSSWSPPASPPDRIFVVGEDSMEAMLAAVGARRGVAVVPEYVSRFYPQPGVAFVPIDALEPCDVAVAALRTRRSEPLIGAFLDAARRSVGPEARFDGGPA